MTDYRLDPVPSSRSPDFAAAYGALETEFAPRGELERRAVVARWLDEPEVAPGQTGLQRTYHLLVARDDRGGLAGVRDGHVVVDRERGVAVVYMAHALVLPPYRRTGLGALLRRAPIEIARRVLDEAGLRAERVEVMLAAEIEPITPEDPASVVRLIAYGRDGFAAIAPAALPYCQPDFRDLGSGAAGASEPRPIPLLAVVRFLGHEDAGRLPSRLARAFVTHLHAVFATHVRADHLATLEARMLGALDAFTADAGADVPLLALPRGEGDLASVVSLSRPALLSFFPAELR